MFYITKDERLVSNVEGKTDLFKAPETVWWLDPDWTWPPYLTIHIRPYDALLSGVDLVLKKSKVEITGLESVW